MAELGESELGTQQYWDSRYKDEIANFENHGDPGEIWFGEDTVERTLKWMSKQNISKKAKILDVGCGNGMFLIELFSKGYTNLFGVDYSEDAVTLAKSICQTRNSNIEYFVCNILEGIEGQFDIIHDKGTYDAISLNANIKEYRVKYLESIHHGLNDHGLFIITSCNWTKNELDEHFQNNFVCIDKIPAPQFKFGGQTGSTVTSDNYTVV